jgi:double-strand break repair protein MRE11
VGIDKKFRHVTKALKVLMKNVQPTEDIEVDENELEDMLTKAKEQQDREYLESAKVAKSSKAKVYPPPNSSPFL